MKSKWIAALAAGVLSGALLLTYSTAAPTGEKPAASIDGAAPDFTLKDTYGKEFKLSEFKGKIVVLEWINQKCPVSKGHHEKGTMQDTYKKYAKDVVWLGIDTGELNKPEENRIYAAQEGLAYPVLSDPTGSVGKMFGAKVTPHMFVIDKKGTLVYAGAIDNKSGDKNYVAAALDAVLAGETVAEPKTEPRGCGVKYPGRRGS